MNLKVKIQDKFFDVEINDITSRPIHAKVDGNVIEVWPEENKHSTSKTPQTLVRQAAAVQHPVIGSSREDENTASNDIQIKAPIPGVIIEIKVSIGDSVTFGQDLCVLEAMKMKNAIRAGKAGIIDKINVSVGDHVSQGQSLMEFRGEV